MSDVTAEHQVTTGDDRPLVTRLVMEVVASVATGLIGVVVIVGALEHSIGWGDAGPEPGYFPFWLGTIIIAASLAAMVQALVQQRGAREVFLTVGQARRVGAFALPVAIFVPVALYLGLYVATAIYLLATMTLQGGYRLTRALPIAIAAPVLLFFLFERAFQVPLLKGPLENALGIY